MKVAALVHMYPPLHNAGAEHMLHAMLSHMVKAGHEAVVVVQQLPKVKQVLEPYTLEGVRVTADWAALRGADAILTHLDRTPEAEEYCLEHNICCVQLMHNHYRPGMARVCDLAVYNSEWLMQKAPAACPSMVLHPPVEVERYKVERTGEYLTLINICPAKGARFFYWLAELLPHYEFLAVRGAYGAQLMPSQRLSNVHVMETQEDVREVYKLTRLLLMPSTYESYGRTAIEACVSGIPVIANSTPGLVEALGQAGVFPKNVQPSPHSLTAELHRRNADVWIAAIREVEAHYSVYSRKAMRHAASLNPHEEMQRFTQVLQAVVNLKSAMRRT